MSLKRSEFCVLCVRVVRVFRADVETLGYVSMVTLLSFVRACLSFPPRCHSEDSAEVTLCQQHLRPSQKKRFVVHVRSAMYHELTRTQPKLEGNVASKKKISRPWRFHRKQKNDICNRQSNLLPFVETVGALVCWFLTRDKSSES